MNTKGIGHRHVHALNINCFKSIFQKSRSTRVNMPDDIPRMGKDMYT